MRKIFSLVLCLLMVMCLLACGNGGETASEQKEEISKDDIYGVWTFESTYTEERDKDISGNVGDSVTSTYEFYEGETGKYDKQNNTNTRGHSSGYMEWSLEDNIIKLAFDGNGSSTVALKVEKVGNEITLTETSDTEVVYRKKK